MATITFDVPGARITELLAAIGHHKALLDANGAARSATAAEGKAWFKEEARAVVLKYREYSRGAISHDFDLEV